MTTTGAPASVAARAAIALVRRVDQPVRRRASGDSTSSGNEPAYTI